MASVNTNPSAMLALQALNASTRQLATAQTRISTGLQVASPKDNAATWAIAHQGRSEQVSWKAIGQSLARTESILDVARSGAESISDLLTEIKGAAIALNDDSLNADSRSALLNQIRALVAQITAVANESTFDGVGLLTPKFDPLEVLSTPVGGPSPTLNFSVPMSRGPGLVNAQFGWENVAPSPQLSGSANLTFGVAPTPGVTTNFSVGLQYGNWNDFSQPGAPSLDFAFTSDPWPVPAPPALPPPTDYGVVFGALTFTPIRTKETFLASPTGPGLDVFYRPMTAEWLGLTGMDSLSPGSILNRVNQVIEQVSGAAGQLGVQQRLATSLYSQSLKMQDVLQSGVGNLVDADLAKEGAELQAAKTRQSLGGQMLSIANAAPQWILNLFR